MYNPVPTEAERIRETPHYRRRAIRQALLITLVGMVLLLLYAGLTATPPSPSLDGVNQGRMFAGAFVAALCIFPLALFTIRLWQWSQRRAEHPSVPVCLLAVAALIPFMFSVAILFFA